MVTTSKMLVSKRNVFSFGLTPADLDRIQSLLGTTAIELVSITELRANPRNAKQHPEQQVSLLCENIREFGFTQPLLADEEKILIAGHARLQHAPKFPFRHRHAEIRVYAWPPTRS